MKRDEIIFISMVRANPHLTLGEIMSLPDFPIAQEKVIYLLEKWHNKGWYTYKDDLYSGSLTPEGLQAARGVGMLVKQENRE